MYYIYIATNKANKVLYTVLTGNILNREDQHKNKYNQNSFSAKYNTNKIVHLKPFSDINNAISREKQIKGWTRKKKLNLIIKNNPGWSDLIKKYWD